MSYNIVCDQCGKEEPDSGDSRRWLNVHDSDYQRSDHQDYDFCSWSCVMEFAKNKPREKEEQA